MEIKKVDWQVIILVCSISIAMVMGVRQALGLFLEPISTFMNDGKEFFFIRYWCSSDCLGFSNVCSWYFN